MVFLCRYITVNSCMDEIRQCFADAGGSSGPEALEIWERIASREKLNVLWALPHESGWTSSRSEVTLSFRDLKPKVSAFCMCRFVLLNTHLAGNYPQNPSAYFSCSVIRVANKKSCPLLMTHSKHSGCYISSSHPLSYFYSNAVKSRCWNKEQGGEKSKYI